MLALPNNRLVDGEIAVKTPREAAQEVVDKAQADWSDAVDLIATLLTTYAAEKDRRIAELEERIRRLTKNMDPACVFLTADKVERDLRNKAIRAEEQTP